MFGEKKILSPTYLLKNIKYRFLFEKNILYGEKNSVSRFCTVK